MSNSNELSIYTPNLSSSYVNQSANDFTTVFNPPLDCSKGNRYTVALEFLSWWYVLQNISQSLYGNATFTWSPNGGTDTYTGVLPAGAYNGPDLIASIYNVIAEAPTGGGTAVADNITLSIADAQGTFAITLTNTGGVSPQFDPSAGGTSSLYKILGAANNTVYSTLGTTIFPNSADVNRGIDSFLIKLDIVAGSTLAGRPDTTFFQFVPVGITPGANYSYTAPFPQPMLMTQTFISSVRVQIVDNLGRSINTQPTGDYSVNGTAIRLAIRQQR